ncbi:tol-pal system YbgF family protein [Arenimonas sp.]|uniref:tetratricopeptide repeat protein n=1 Tax=Arenimonas sp. TaxID=1872635 RepID=UPI0035B27872
MANRSPVAGSLFERLPGLLAYPATRDMLLMFAGLALFRLLSNLPNILGMLFELAFWVMGFKMAVEALTNTAQGRYEALHGEDMLATDGDAIEQLVLGVLVGLAVTLVAVYLGLVATAVALLAVFLFMPAAVMLLAINHHYLNALNPLAWFELIRRLGGAYFGVVLVFAILGLLSEALQWGFMAVMGDPGQVPGSFIALYALVASYHVLGDALHRHHEVLGLDVTPAVARATYANPIEDETMARAGELAAQGKPAAAAELLAGLFRGRGASDPVHDRFRELLIAEGELERLAAHDREYISSLVVTDKEKRALAVYADTAERVRGFRLDLPDQTARLVALAARLGQAQRAVALAQDFEGRFPDSPDLPQVVLTAATLLSERLGRDEEARDRLRALLRTHPGHPLAAQARTQLAALERVLAASPGFKGP